MSAAIIGLVGATVGALATLLGGMLTQRWQDHRDDAKWRRDKRAEAYDGALRHLLRAANLRSEFAGGTGGAVLKQEHQREWFDDLVQAQFWMHTVSQYCESGQLPNVLETARLLDSHVDRLLSSQSFDQKGFSIWETLQRCITAVTASARADAGDHTAVTSAEPTVTVGGHLQQINMVADRGTVYATESGVIVSAADLGAPRSRVLLNIDMAPSSPSEARQIDTTDAGGTSATDSGSRTTDPINDQPK